jgi:hypothetical protein
MPEAQTELDAESAILSAVMGDEPPVSAPDTDDLDRVEAKDVTSPQEATEEKAEPEVEAKAEDPSDDVIEVPGEEGQEPTRYSVKEAVEALQARQKLEAEREQIYTQTIEQGRQAATQLYTQAREYTQGVQHQLQAVLSLIAPPQPPNMAMLDPANPAYNPDQYHLAFAQYQQAGMRYQQAQHIAAQLGQRVSAQQEWEQGQRLDVELVRLEKAWPDFTNPEKRDAFVKDMQKEYGYTLEELDDSLTDHRNALVARDALAYRAMKKGAPAVKEQVQKAAPKLVRSKQEAKGSPAQARDSGGKFTGEALAALKRTNSDDAAAAYFAGLSRSGRI